MDKYGTQTQVSIQEINAHMLLTYSVATMIDICTMIDRQTEIDTQSEIDIWKADVIRPYVSAIRWPDIRTDAGAYTWIRTI